MKRRIWILTAALIALSLFQAGPASAQQRLIVRTTNLPILKNVCLLNLCQVSSALDGTIGQLFLITSPSLLPVQTLENVLRLVPGVLGVEQDLLRTVGPTPPLLNGIPLGLYQRSPVAFAGATVWSGYATQPAVADINLPEARVFNTTSGKIIVADIDTGVDPSHPALKAVLLQGYDFTRNQVGGNEMLDVSNPNAKACNGNNCSSANVNQSTAAVLDQSTAAVLDQSTAAVLDQPGYSDFGHGTMVLGIIHLVAPNAMLLPVKVFHADGTGYTSDIIRGLYYAVQNKANVINMSFDFTVPSSELAAAIANAEKNSVVCVASAGNDGVSEMVYPAGLGGVIGVASVNDAGQRSTFSNYGSQITDVAAPGENIVSTYPYSTYASSSGTSFSAPFVAGTAALALQMGSKATAQEAASAIAQAQPLNPQMGHGLLDVFHAMTYMQAVMGAK
jgi:subtilisin family serine protease